LTVACLFLKCLPCLLQAERFVNKLGHSTHNCNQALRKQVEVLKTNFKFAHQQGLVLSATILNSKVDKCLHWLVQSLDIHLLNFNCHVNQNLTSYGEISVS